MSEGAARIHFVAPGVYVTLVGILREAARPLGYALTVHGSLARDLDLVAIPWAAEAAPPEELVAALVLASGGLQGPHANNPKPHGRRGWTISLGAGAYIDLSVMPRSAPGL